MALITLRHIHTLKEIPPITETFVERFTFFYAEIQNNLVRFNDMIGPHLIIVI